MSCSLKKNLLKKEVKETCLLWYLELMMSGLIETTLSQVVNARLDSIGKDETESVLLNYKNTIREKLKDFVNHV